MGQIGVGPCTDLQQIGTNDMEGLTCWPKKQSYIGGVAVEGQHRGRGGVVKRGLWAYVPHCQRTRRPSGQDIRHWLRLTDSLP